MTTDAQLREVFERKAQEMNLRDEMPDALARRVRIRQATKIVVAGAAVADLAILVYGLGTEVFRQTAPIPPAGEETPSPTEFATDGTVIFTGDDCVYSGTHTFLPPHEDNLFVSFTLANESSIEAFLNVTELPSNTSVEDFVADLPVIEDRTSISCPPASILRSRVGRAAPKRSARRSAPTALRCVLFDVLLFSRVCSGTPCHLLLHV
jgi:hypothetical protein